MILLIKYELNKMKQFKGIYIGAAIFIVVFALYIFSSAPSSLFNYRGSYRYYKTGEGVVTQAKISMAREGMKELKKLYDAGIRLDERDLGRSLLYYDIISVEKQKTEYRNALSKLRNDGIKDSKEKFVYNSLKKIGPLNSAHYTEGWKEIIAFYGDIGYYLITLLTLFGVSNLIPQEFASGMGDIINSTKESRRRYIIGKISTAVIYTSIVTIFFSIINLAVNWYLYGLYGWDANIRSIMHNSPYNMSILKFYLLEMVVVIGVNSILGLLTMIISIVTKSSIAALSAGGIIFAILSLLGTSSGSGIEGTIRYIVTDFVRLKGFCSNYLNVYSILGAYIRYEVVIPLIIIILLTILSLSACPLYSRIARNGSIGGK